MRNGECGGRSAIGASAPHRPPFLGSLAVAASIALLASAAEAAPAPPGGQPLQAPFTTLLPWVLPEKALQTNCAGIAARGEPAPFGGEPRSRAALLCEISGGLGSRVEGWMQMGVQDLSGTEADGGPVASDLRLALQYTLTGSADRSRALAASFTAKAPTAPDGAGTDEADLGARLAAGWKGRRTGGFVSAGIDLLGNPRRNGSQDDVAVYGAGFWHEIGSRWRVSAEIEGRALSRFENSGALLRLGALWSPGSRSRGRLALHAGVAFGLDDGAAEWEARAGLSYARP